MKHIVSIGDALVNPQGNKLTVEKWLPDKGIFIIGKWLLRNKRGTTCQLSTVELYDRGYDQLA